MPGLTKIIEEDTTFHQDHPASFYSAESLNLSNYGDSILDIYFEKSFSEANEDCSSNKDRRTRKPTFRNPSTYLDTFSSFPTFVDRGQRENFNMNTERHNLYEGATLRSKSPQLWFKKSTKNALQTAISNFHNKRGNRKSILINKDDISNPIWLSAYEYQQIQEAYSKKSKQLSRKPTIMDKFFPKDKHVKTTRLVKKSENLPSKPVENTNSKSEFKTRESLVQAYIKKKKKSLDLPDTAIFDETSNGRKSLMNLVNDDKFFSDNDENNTKLKRLSVQIKSQYQLLNKLEQS